MASNTCKKSAKATCKNYELTGRLAANKKRTAEREKRKYSKKQAKLSRRLKAGLPVPRRFKKSS